MGDKGFTYVRRDGGQEGVLFLGLGFGTCEQSFQGRHCLNCFDGTAIASTP